MLKNVITSTVLFLFAFVNISFAQDVTTTSQTDNTNCVASAIAVRETAIQTAFTNFSSSMSSAFTKRASDLATGSVLTDRIARNSAIKNAGQSFRNSSISAKKTYNTARQSAWQQFSTARKSCKAPATGESVNMDLI